MHRSFALFILLFCTTLACATFPQALRASTLSTDVELTYKNISSWHTSLDKLANYLDSPADDDLDAYLPALKDTLERHEQLTNYCLEDLSARIDTIDEELSVIGDPSNSEADASAAKLKDVNDVAVARQSLKKERSNHSRKLTSCKLLEVKSEKVRAKLEALHERIERTKRLYKSDNVFRVLAKLGDVHPFKAIYSAFSVPDWGTHHFSRLIWFLYGLGLFALVPTLAFVYRRRTKMCAAVDLSNFSNRLLFSVLINNNICFFAFGLVSYTLIFISIWFASSGISTPIFRLILDLEITLVLLVITNAVFTQHHSMEPLISVNSRDLSLLRRHTRFLIVFFFIDYSLTHWPSDIIATEQSVNAARLVFLFSYLYSLSKVYWFLIGNFPAKTLRPLKFLIPPLAATSVMLIAAGYHNFFNHVFQSLAFTFFIVYGGYLLFKIFTDALDSFDEGRFEWQRKVKTTLDINHDDIMPGIIWIRIIQVMLIIVGALVLLLNEWDISRLAPDDLLKYFADGLEFGQITIVPKQIFQSLLFIAISMSILLWARKQFDLRVLSKSRMDVGARDALGSILMYSLGFMSILIAVSIAGVNLSNIAIVAGALSVGIGFGLQAIVNNFVSGLILLLERPIQKGDWVIVDNTEGHVQNISVRSTLIQTFDKADVIVPNSDLITHVVKNWTHKDSTGRISIAVGISYQADLEQARDILLDIASKRPETVENYNVSGPRVLCVNFGDSAIELELRFFVRQINDRLSIASDVRFEIIKRFKQESIEIPFPQRVLHNAEPNLDSKDIED